MTEEERAFRVAERQALALEIDRHCDLVVEARLRIEELDRELKPPAGVNRTQRRVLALLGKDDGEGGQSSLALCSAMQDVTESTVRSAIGQLEVKGLVLGHGRMRHGRGGGRRYLLTLEGERMFKAGVLGE